MGNLIELTAKREALKAEMERAAAEMKAKIDAVEAEMREARKATVTIKPGDVIETRRGPVKVSAVHVWADDMAVYGFRKTPGGRWSTKERTIWDLEYDDKEK